jgi:tRNA threonylcarbamoyladenosine modification (KEOPS) complex  Pcc1 subunit
LVFNYEQSEDANVVKQTLDVDAEQSPEKIVREISICGSDLRVKWRAVEIKILRSAVLAFFLNLQLVTETILKFKPGNQVKLV